MRIVLPAVLAAVMGVSSAAPRTAPKVLTIYFIDVEGGQATLLVGPSGASLLIDAGFPSDGTFQSKPGDPAAARDAKRILAATKDAGITAIDDLLVTHFHADHAGGVAELSHLIPIRTFVDHDTVLDKADETVAGTLAVFQTYVDARAGHPHIDAKPGDHLRIPGMDVVVVSSGGRTITRALPGGGERTAACGSTGLDAQEPNENPRSTGVLVTFGRFKFLDVGDLSGRPLFTLACPRSLVGDVDAYLVAHHGGVDAADPATFAAFRPTVAIVNNGPTKGGAPETLALLHDGKTHPDVWQLHRSANDGARNFADDRIANLDTTTAFWLKLVVTGDGSSFQVINGRTNTGRTYDKVKVN